MASWIDIHITAVEDTPNIWEYEWVLSDWSRFPIDLTALIPPTSHVPAVINGNGIVTSVPSWIDNQTFQLWLNIWQLPSTDSNNQVVLWTDWKLYVAQTTIATSWFNFVNTIADRDAQTVSDWHITQVIAAIDPNDNGFYIYDSATTSWTELIPNATVISVNGHTWVVVLIPSDLTYVATISWTPVTNVQEALDAIKDFLNNFDNNVADSITNSLAVQTALENFIENTNFTLLGDITFQDNTVTFDNSTVNFENWTTLNYDSTVVSNHNGDTVNYDWSTINSNNTEYNHTGDTINYDATTTVDGGTFNNNTFNNPTFTWNIGVNVKYKNVELSWQTAWATYTLPTAPSWDIQVSIKNGVIQSEVTPDYTHTASTTTFTMVDDRTGQTVMISYIEAVMSPAPWAVQSVTGNIVDNTDPLNPVVDQVQSDWNQTDNTQPDYIKNKPSVVWWVSSWPHIVQSLSCSSTAQNTSPPLAPAASDSDVSSSILIEWTAIAILSLSSSVHAVNWNTLWFDYWCAMAQLQVSDDNITRYDYFSTDRTQFNNPFWTVVWNVTTYTNISNSYTSYRITLPKWWYIRLKTQAYVWSQNLWTTRTASASATLTDIIDS